MMTDGEKQPLALRRPVSVDAAMRFLCPAGKFGRSANRADRDRIELLQDQEPLDFTADSLADDADDRDPGR